MGHFPYLRKIGFRGECGFANTWKLFGERFTGNSTVHHHVERLVMCQPFVHKISFYPGGSPMTWVWCWGHRGWAMSNDQPKVRQFINGNWGIGAHVGLTGHHAISSWIPGTGLGPQPRNCPAIPKLSMSFCLLLSCLFLARAPVYTCSVLFHSKYEWTLRSEKTQSNLILNKAEIQRNGAVDFSYLHTVFSLEIFSVWRSCDTIGGQRTTGTAPLYKFQGNSRWQLTVEWLEKCVLGPGPDSVSLHLLPSIVSGTLHVAGSQQLSDLWRAR